MAPPGFALAAPWGRHSVGSTYAAERFTAQRADNAELHPAMVVLTQRDPAETFFASGRQAVASWPTPGGLGVGRAGSRTRHFRSGGLWVEITAAPGQRTHVWP
jgi:hypothetical protein